jgi:hypothetical protein
MVLVQEATRRLAKAEAEALGERELRRRGDEARVA